MGILRINCGFGFRSSSARGFDGAIRSIEMCTKIPPETLSDNFALYTKIYHCVKFKVWRTSIPERRVNRNKRTQSCIGGYNDRNIKLLFFHLGVCISVERICAAAHNGSIHTHTTQTIKTKRTKP
jgi:hypothetical protein